MKRFGFYLLGIIAVVSLGVGGVAAAATSSSAQTVSSLNTTQSFNGLYVRAAETVKVKGVVNGDVIVAGNDVSIDGVVNGSVYAAAQSITITGKVSGNVHLAASHITINGQTGSVYAVGSDIMLTKTSQSGGLVMAASNIDVNGKSSQGAYLAGSIVTVDGAVGGPLSLAGTTLSIGSDAKVAGDLTYSSSVPIEIANDRNVSGSVHKVDTAAAQKSDVAGKLFGLLYGVLASLVLGLVLLKFAPASFSTTTDYLAKNPARSLLVGLGFIVLAPLVAILLLITVVGLPVAILAGLAYVAIWIVAGLFPALWVGRTVLRRPSRTFADNALALLIGLSLLGVVSLLPVLGGVVQILAFLGGVGALVARNWQRIRHVGSLQAKA